MHRIGMKRAGGGGEAFSYTAQVEGYSKVPNVMTIIYFISLHFMPSIFQESESLGFGVSLGDNRAECNGGFRLTR